MIRVWMLALFVSVPASATVAIAQQPQPAPAWQLELQHRREALVERNGSGTNAALRDQLLAMRDQDQRARGMAGDAGKPGPIEIAGNLAEIDAALTAQLKQVVAASGWPTIAMVGIDASNAAMLVLTHTADHAWQRSLLPKLEELADAQQIDGSALALVIDKELVAEGKLQRYGTQFKRVPEGIAMYGVEDPAGLDTLREQVMLPPIDVYKQQLSSLYHLKATNQIVMAPAPK
jgi:hypothetical protein